MLNTLGTDIKMEIVSSIKDLHLVLQPFKKPVFVPTMGNLHDGHLALIHAAKPLGDVTVSSIFINRLQFLPNEDFDKYPRTWEADCNKLKDAQCDILFSPPEFELYPQMQTFKISPSEDLSNILEGRYRPGFFTGV